MHVLHVLFCMQYFILNFGVKESGWLSGWVIIGACKGMDAAGEAARLSENKGTTHKHSHFPPWLSKIIHVWPIPRNYVFAKTSTGVNAFILTCKCHVIYLVFISVKSVLASKWKLYIEEHLNGMIVVILAWCIIYTTMADNYVISFSGSPVHSLRFQRGNFLSYIIFCTFKF